MAVHAGCYLLARNTLLAYIFPMTTACIFDWTDAKSDACLADRGFDFAYAAGIFLGDVMERIDSRKDYGECVLYTSTNPRDRQKTRMPASA